MSQKTLKKIFLSASELMPNDAESTRILRSRSNYLSLRKQDKATKEGLIPYIKFRLGLNEWYGIPYSCTQEVMQHVVPTKLPFAPASVAGVINRRGALLAVFDLKKVFNIKSSSTEATHTILISIGEMRVGILVDSIEGSDAYNPLMLDVALTSESINMPDYILGLHQGVTAIINIEPLLSDLQQQLMNKGVM